MLIARPLLHKLAHNAARSLARQQQQQRLSIRGMAAVAAAHDGPVNGLSGAIGNTPLVSECSSHIHTTPRYLRQSTEDLGFSASFSLRSA